MQQENIRTYYTRPIRRRVDESSIKLVPIDELTNIYEKYKRAPSNQDGEEDEEKEGIDGEGILEFSKEINVNPEDITLLILFWKLGCTEKYFITKDQFIRGFASLGMETLAKMKKKIPNLRKEIESDSAFKQFYMFCFNYMRENGQKRISVDDAVATWRLVLKGKYKYLEEWCKFMETNYKHNISADTWKMFLEYIRDEEAQDFENYKIVESAYPSAIDDFVDWMKKQKAEGKNISEEKGDDKMDEK